jgi:hypothetical protein
MGDRHGGDPGAEPRHRSGWLRAGHVRDAQQRRVGRRPRDLIVDRQQLAVVELEARGQLERLADGRDDALRAARLDHETARLRVPATRMGLGRRDHEDRHEQHARNEKMARRHRRSSTRCIRRAGRQLACAAALSCRAADEVAKCRGPRSGA